MQLITPGLREGLALAVCVLLTTQTATADDSADTGDNGPVTRTDLGAMSYRESDKRINSTELMASIRNTWSDNSSLNINLAFDTLSGGSPNGALPSHAVQTFATPSGRTLTRTAQPAAPTVQTCTTPSGNVYSCGGGAADPNRSIYDIAAGSLPMDHSFRDRRSAVSGSYNTDLSRTLHLSLNGGFSKETDFTSLSAGAGVAQDLFSKNTTLSLGVNTEHDSIKPIGGTPVPLTDYSQFQRQDDSSKSVNGLQLGLTQVLNRRWLTLLNVAEDRTHGYQNDPYKIVSGLDSNGNVVGYIYENRPDARTRKSLYWENRFALDEDTITLSARAMRDDWGIRSKTVELRYRFEMDEGRFLEPQVRWYSQTAADFYRLYVLQGAPYVNAVSADPRLGQFSARTYGLKYGYRFDRDSVLSFRVERYQQKGVVNQAILPQLQGLDLYPGLSATVFAADLQFRF